MAGNLRARWGVTHMSAIMGLCFGTSHATFPTTSAAARERGAVVVLARGAAGARLRQHPARALAARRRDARTPEDLCLWLRTPS